MNTFEVIGCSGLLVIVLIIYKLFPCYLAATCFEWAYSRWNCVRKCSARRNGFFILCVGIRILLPYSDDGKLSSEFRSYINKQWGNRVQRICAVPTDDGFLSDLDFTYPWGVRSRVKKLEKRVEKLEKKIVQYEKI